MLAILPLLVISQAAPAATARQPELVRPNFLIVLVDDLGLDQLRAFDDVSQYPAATPPNDYPYASTPTIDALAASGTRFVQARAYPLCSPTRAALQSGKYGLRTGCGTIVSGAVQGHPTYTSTFREFSVPPSPVVATLADLLRPRGWATGMFGKLHLHLEEDAPDLGTGDSYAHTVLGFDEFHGIARNPDNAPTPPTDGSVDIREVSFTYYYWIDSSAAGTTRRIIHGPPQTDYYRGEYLTTKQRHAVEEWTTPAQEPFLVLWCANDLHGPYQWPPDQLDGDGHGFGAAEPECHADYVGCDADADGCGGGPGVEIYGNTRARAKLEYVDRALGNLLDHMDPQVRARTYVMVMGDNGTQGALTGVDDDEVRYPANYPSGGDPACFDMQPYTGARMKGTAYEGGVRVPLIVAGPGVVPRTSTALVDVVDVYETLADVTAVATGSAYVPTGTNDSVSFADILRGGSDLQHARQCSHSGVFTPNGVYGQEALEAESQYFLRRDECGNLWKIVRVRVSPVGPFQDSFFNVRSDPFERTDLGVNHQKYAAVRADFDQLLGGATLAQIQCGMPMACP